MSDQDESRSVDPSRFRSRFQEDAAADYEKIREALLESLEAVKDVRTTCPACSKAITVTVRDNSAVNKAVELYTTIPYGRVGVESGPSPEEERAHELHEMSGDELTERRMTWLVQRVNDGGPELRSQLREKWAPMLLEALEAA